MRVFLLLVPILLQTSIVRAATVTTDPMGCVNIAIKANSDTIVSVPLVPDPSFTGAVASASSGGTGLFNIDASGTPGWTANEFAGLYYVRMTSGAKNGMYYTITANTAGRVTVDTAGDDLSGIATSDSFVIYKYWTLGTLFPPASAGTATNPLTASADVSPGNRRSQILLPDNASAGTNLALGETYFFTSGGWFSAAAGNPSATDTILLPDSCFVIRQAAVATDTTWRSVGNVVMSRLVIPLTTQAGQSQDNYVSINRPVDVKLSESGLESGFVESAGAAAFQRRDMLFVFDNSTASFNKSPATIYFRQGGNWRKAGGSAPVANDDVIPAGAGVIIRKYATSGAPTAFWTNNPNY